MACAGNSSDQGLGTVESLRYRLKEEISSQERYSFDISITRRYLLKYIVQRRDQKQPLEGTELDKTLESAKIIVDLLSSKMLIDWSGKEAVELIFGCLRILIKLHRDGDVCMEFLHRYSVEFAFYLNRHLVIALHRSEEQLRLALSHLLRFGVEVAIYQLRRAACSSHRKSITRSSSSQQQRNSHENINHEELKKLIMDLGYSEFDEELWIDITRSTTRLEVALRGSGHDSLIDGVTSHQFLEFAEQYASKHSEESTRSSALQSAMGLCGSLSPFENSTSKALIQTVRLLLGCLLILFQLSHLEDSSLELTLKLFHKYDLALSRTSITVFQDRQTLNQTLAEKLQFSVEWVVYLHMRTESSARYQTAISDMTDYGLKCLDRASFWLYAHHSQKSTGRFATESEDPEKQPRSQTMGLYEFRAKPGAGTATFATQAIPRGTIIMEEQPLLSAPMRKSFRSPFEVWNRLDEQPEERQRDFRALFHSVPKLNQVRERADQLMDKLLVDDTDVDVSDAILVTGIYDTNAFRGGVYRDQSRMNHMCTFNAMQGVRDDGSQYMEAMRNIKKGEELTCPYVNTLDSYEYRQRSLELWGFTCTCPLCEMEQFVQETSCLEKEETEPGFDPDGLEDMINFMRIWFEAVQTTCDTDERRWRAELYMVEVEDAGFMFERAYRLFDRIQERNPSDQTEANKVTIENILADLKTSRQYWRPDDEEEGGRRRRTLRKAVNFARRLGRAFHIKHR